MSGAHTAIAPIVLPALAGVLHLALARFGARVHRTVALVAVLALLGVAVLVLSRVAGAPGPEVYRVGGYGAPYGIVLVADRLAAALLGVAALVGAAAVGYAVLGADPPDATVLALFQFALMGVDGAVLSGDLFNLYVFFEVLLTASYGLLVLGEAARRTRSALGYIVANLVESAVLVMAVALVYATTGTLNLADLAVELAAAAPEDVPLLRLAGMLLLATLAGKAVQLPLHIEMAPTRGPAGPAVAGLFALLAAVCAYAVLRLFALLYGAGAAPGLAGLAAPYLLPAALAVLAAAAAAALGAHRIDRLAVYLVVVATALPLAAFGLFTPAGFAAGLTLLGHGAVVGCLLFLLVGLLDDEPETGRRWLPRAGCVAAALALAGLPPLAGFLGKALLLDAASGGGGGGGGAALAVWTVVPASAVVALLACAQAGATLLPPDLTMAAAPGVRPAGRLVPVALLLGAAVAAVVFAGPVQAYVDAAAAELARPRTYVAAVLGAAVAQGMPTP